MTKHTLKGAAVSLWGPSVLALLFLFTILTAVWGWKQEFPLLSSASLSRLQAECGLVIPVVLAYSGKLPACKLTG